MTNAQCTLNYTVNQTDAFLNAVLPPPATGTGSHKRFVESPVLVATFAVRRY